MDTLGRTLGEIEDIDDQEMPGIIEYPQEEVGDAFSGCGYRNGSDSSGKGQ